MRILAASALLASCGFSVDAMAIDAPKGDGKRDAPIDAQGFCGGKVWLADFSTDPTHLDVNGDGIADWGMRDLTPFPTAEMTSGVWHIPSAALPPMDTQPKQMFDTRTIIHGRMKGAASNGAKGAVVYINIGFLSPTAGLYTFAPCYVDAKLEAAGTQTLNLWAIDPTGVDTKLTTISDLPNDFVDFDLDLDPTTLQATFSGAGLPAAKFTLFRQGATPSTPEWVSVLGYSTAADFDYVRVEVCP